MASQHLHPLTKGLWHDSGWPEPETDEVVSADNWFVRQPALDVLLSSGATVLFGEAKTAAERRVDDVGQQFRDLADEWSRQTAMLSDLHQIVLNSAYQRIIGLGMPVVPHILNALREQPDHWFWALAAIVGSDHGQGATTFNEAAERWLAWGATVGFIA